MLQPVPWPPWRPVIPALAAGLWLATAMERAGAATIQEGDVTSTLGPTFFVDDAALGGSDTDINHNATASFVRLFNGLLVPNQGPTRVVLTGFGFATHTSATSNDATTITVTFTYLGANGAVGGGDDVVIGGATGNFTFSGGKEYVFAFDTPLSADLDITGTRFRIQVAPVNANHAAQPDIALKLKTATLASEPSVTGAKLSVAGFAAPVINPQRLNLAKFQPVTTSSVSGQRLASYVTDGNAGNDNRWQSNGSGPHWAEVDFPFPVEIGSAQVFTGVDDTNAQTSFRIQYLSGASWVDAPGAVITGNTNVERNIVFTNPVTAPSFRIYSTDGTMRIRELALYPPDGASGFAPGTDLTLNLAYQRQAVAAAATTGNFALNTVDGRANGYAWQTDTVGTNNLDIDLRVSTKIGSAHLYSGSTGVSPLADFTLKSWDGSGWLNISGGSVGGNTNPDLIIPFTTPVTTSKVRLEFTNPGTTSIRELCIFPANTGNTGYPLGTNISASGVFARYEDYGDAFYQIEQPSSGRFVTVAGGGQPALDQAGLATAQGQYQVLLNLSTGTYRLRNRATGNCLSGARLSKTPGEPLTDAPYAALPHQDWILRSLGGGAFQLVNQWSGLVVDTLNGATSAGTTLVQNTTNGSATQRWRFSYLTWYPKKGIGGTGFAGAFNANWTYNWGLGNSNSLPAGTLFNPMQWGDFNWGYDTSANSTWKLYPAWRATGGPLHLLGFNEPDEWSQSGKSLDQTNPPTKADFSWERSMNEAVLMWPRLQAMDVPLVSPAPASMSGGWLDGFFAQAENLGYRVDYTAIHTYPGPGGGSSDGLVGTLQSAYNTWNRPVWLTEFSFVDWNGNSSWSEEDNYNCLAEFLWRAESLPWLRKYALFVFTEDANNPQPAQPWSTSTSAGGAPRSNAYDISGNLTAFGKLYAAWDNDAAVRTGKSYYLHHKGTRKRLANLPGSDLGGRSIRVDDHSVRWTLAAAGTAGCYHVVSSRDGRRLSHVNNGPVTLAAAGTTGTAVEWSLTETRHGWFHLDHPATSKRLKLAYDNSNDTATYSMVADTTTGAEVEWRFIVPPPSPVWSGSRGAGWTDNRNWVPGIVPATDDTVTFDTTSVANLGTTLEQDFNLNAIVVKNPVGSVTIGGTHSLTIGSGGLDLSAATRSLTINAPLTLGAPQSWNVAAGQSLAIAGALAGTHAVSISGAGTVNLATAPDLQLPFTIAAGATLRTTASNVLPNGAAALTPTLAGTLDLNGTSQGLNTLAGGTVENTAPTAATLTVGHTNTAVTLTSLLRNSGGPLALVKTGSGQLTLPSANTHSGGFTNHGTGNVAPQNINAFGTGPVVMNAGTLYSTAGNYTFGNALTLNGATLRVGGGTGRTITWTGPVSVTADSTIQCDGGTAGITLAGNVNIAGFTLSSAPNNTSNTISGAITGAGAIMAATFSNGTLNLNAANPFSGTFRSALGTLRIGDALAMQNGTLDMNAADSGGVNLNNLNAVIGALAGTRNLALGSGTVSIGNNHASTTYSGVLSGSGSLVKTGNGTLTLAGTNTYGGTTTIGAGALTLAANNVLPGTAVSIGEGSLELAPNVTDTTGTLDVIHPASTIHFGSGATLAFANSSAVNWSGGALTITGNFLPGSSLRFGTNASGLTATQLSKITAPGWTAFTLNTNGYLTATASGTSYESWSAQISNGLTRRTDDADGDGFTNLEEFLFGTSPTATDGNPTTIERSGPTLVIRWKERTTGAAYTLLESPTPGNGWTISSTLPVNDGTAVGDYQPRMATIAIGSDRSFFRVQGVEN